MKKVFALILTLVMMCSLSLSVSAANVGVGSSEVAEVKVAVVDGGSTTPTVYYITVTWDSLTFTYTEAEEVRDWNPEEHKYDTKQEDGSWDKTAADITVTNHSNTDIGVAMNFDGSGTSKTVSGVTATLSNHTFDLDTAEDIAEFANADKDVTTVSVSNKPSVGEGFTVGMINIVITDK